MAKASEILLGKIAVRMNLITEEKLQQCIRIQSGSKGNPSLGELLLKKGYLTKAQLRKVLEVQKRALERKETITQKRLEDVIFGKVLINRGLSSKKDVHLALREQANLKEQGVSKRLGEILVERGILLPSQVEDALGHQKKQILICDQCLSQFNVVNYTDGMTVKCTKCSYPLSLPNKLYSISVDEATTLVGDYQDYDSDAQIATSRRIVVGEEENLVGRVVGGCKILEKLGQGGMGTVYRAHHVGLDKQVAFKVLPVQYTDDASFVERFSREARSAAKLEHPNIVQVLNVGLEMIDAKEYHYIVMQYVEGKSVEDIIRQRRRLKVEEATRIVREAAKGLAAAHARKIIHRDVKPDNIMITSDGLVKVTDFGLARSTEVPSDITQDGQVMGTPFFMSPEQADNEPVDGRSDLYSLGVTYYYMITGEKPFVAETPLQVMMKHINEEFAFPDRFQETIPISVQRAIEKLLAKRADTRYQTAKDLIRALDKILKGEDITAPIEVGEGINRQEGSMSKVVVYGALVLILAGLAFVLYHLQQNLTQEPPAPGPSGPATVVNVGGSGPDREEEARQRAQIIRQEAIRLSDREMHIAAYLKYEEFLKFGYPPTHPEWEGLKRQRDDLVPKIKEGLPADIERSRGLAREGKFEEALKPLRDYRHVDEETALVTRVEEVIAEIEDAKSGGAEALGMADKEAAVLIQKRDYEPARDLYVELQGLFEPYHEEQPLKVEVQRRLAEMDERIKFGQDLERAQGQIEGGRPMDALNLMKKYEDARLSDVEREAEGMRDRAQAWIEFLPAQKKVRKQIFEDAEFDDARTTVGFYKEHLEPSIQVEAEKLSAALEVAERYHEKKTEAEGLIVDKKDYDGALQIYQAFIDQGQVQEIVKKATAAADGLRSLIDGLRYDELGHRQRALGLLDDASRSPDEVVSAEAKRLQGEVQARFDEDRRVGMTEIAEGPFYLGSDRNPMERPLRHIQIDSFWIDEREVTNAQYARFLRFLSETGDHSTCHPQEGPDKDHTPLGWDERMGAADLPVVGVDWYDSYAFAAWSGKRLLAEGEWEKAARGEDGRNYPWGKDFDMTLCNVGGEGPVPVGSFPGGKSAYGVLDLAGNVWEWTAGPDPGYAATATTPTSDRPIRGGGWKEDALTRPLSARCTTRLLLDPRKRRLDLGFRCAAGE